jgi:hypothetical protein
MWFAASRRKRSFNWLKHQTVTGEWNGEANGGTPLAARETRALPIPI